MHNLCVYVYIHHISIILLSYSSTILLLYCHTTYRHTHTFLKLSYVTHWPSSTFISTITFLKALSCWYMEMKIHSLKLPCDFFALYSVALGDEFWKNTIYLCLQKRCTENRTWKAGKKYIHKKTLSKLTETYLIICFVFSFRIWGLLSLFYSIADLRQICLSILLGMKGRFPIMMWKSSTDMTAYSTQG